MFLTLSSLSTSSWELDARYETFLTLYKQALWPGNEGSQILHGDFSVLLQTQQHETHAEHFSCLKPPKQKETEMGRWCDHPHGGCFPLSLWQAYVLSTALTHKTLKINTFP